MVRTFIAALSVATVIAFAAAGVGRAADSKKCTIATKGDNDVAKACAAGGIPRAKTVMKNMVKQAKDKGKKFECDGCHKNEEDWKLTDDAEKSFKDLLAAVAAK